VKFYRAGGVVAAVAAVVLGAAPSPLVRIE